MNPPAQAARITAAWAGAVLIGLGATSCDNSPPRQPVTRPPDGLRRLELPPAIPAARPAPAAAPAVPLAVPTVEERARQSREVLGAALRESRRRPALLASASDRALARPSPETWPAPQVVPQSPLAVAIAAVGETAQAPLLPQAAAVDTGSTAEQPREPPVQLAVAAIAPAPLLAGATADASASAPASPAMAEAFADLALSIVPASIVPASTVPGSTVPEPGAVAGLAELPSPPPPAASAPARLAIPVVAAEPAPMPAAAAPPPAPSPATALTAPGSAPGAASATAALAPDGTRSALGSGASAPVLDYQDELILDIQVAGVPASDTVLAYGTRAGTFLPLGTLARILDLAITVSDDGHYASGWFLSQDRRLVLDLRNGTLTSNGSETPLPADLAVAFDGELFLRADAFGAVLPLDLVVNLREQAVTITTRERFPFEERIAREAERERLASRRADTQTRWPRQATPWLALSTPLADVELRAVSDDARGERLEADVRLAGDLAFLTAEAFFSADSRSGLTASLLELGRTDPDADLLGPLRATSFALGDIGTHPLPLGLRGVSGRGVVLTNSPLEVASVFERIDLRGVLTDGYEVELYRNDILVGSTADPVNGQYEFLQVPVDFGLNVFRLVFYGPQGQRREEVRRISVGDGRLAAGQLVYRIGAVQKDRNLFDVRDPLYIAPADAGSWRATGELAYGLSSGVTAIASGAWYQTLLADRWQAGLGLRSGIGALAARADVALADSGAMAIRAGVGGRIGSASFSASHSEYSGGFADETLTVGREGMRRASELDLNAALVLGSAITVPLTARLRHYETAAGRVQTSAALRASTRLSGLQLSNTLEYARNSGQQLATNAQLFGNFDLATVSRARLRGRVSLGYDVLPRPRLSAVSVQADWALDDASALRGQFAYAFAGGGAQAGISAIREFDSFTISADAIHAFDTGSWTLGLRLAASFGHDPLRGRAFMARPGIAGQGAVAARAYHDRDGDGRFSDQDLPLGEVDVIAFNQSVSTRADGTALLAGLGAGQRVSLQLDSASLPDIALAPASGGIEIIARPGRVHRADFAVVALSELEGTVLFTPEGGAARGVSGVRLQLVRDGAAAATAADERELWARSEVGGYVYFEQVRPGAYQLLLDPAQAERLNLCLAGDNQLQVGNESDLLSFEVDLRPCPVSAERVAIAH